MVRDETKRLRNLRPEPEGHGLDFAEADAFFDWDGALVASGKPGEDGRPRFAATGRMNARLVTLVFAPLGSEAISAISLRDASRKERKAHATR